MNKQLITRKLRRPKGASQPGSAHSNPTRAIPSARGAAFRLLGEVLEHGRPFDDVLARAQIPGGFLSRTEPRERGFARLLMMTTLRRLGQIDDALKRLIAKPLPREAGAARQALRLGAAQLLFLNTPAHAAVDGSVCLLPASSPQKGLVNAVLRRLSVEKDEIINAQDAVRLNMPDWLWQRRLSTYGEATTRAIGAVELIEPPLDITLKPGSNISFWAGQLQAQSLPTGSLRLVEHGPIEDLPGYAQGAWWIQDAAAALPAQLLAAQKDERIADLCAAPGGKTAMFSARGAEVFAIDRDAGRLTRLQENLTRLGLSAHIIHAPAETWIAPAPLDAVLLDAPCSATGTLRRHPDIPWVKNLDDIASLRDIQAKLLAASANMLRVGGRLIYCVCSLEPEEGETQIATFLTSPVGRKFKLMPIGANEVPGLGTALTAQGELRTLPCHWADLGGMDGFYVARLIRTEA